MAHNLYIDKYNRASFFSAREIAWHGLGQVVEGALTSKEAILQAHLDYEVGLAPIHGRIKEITVEEARMSNNVIKEVDSKGNTHYFQSSPLDGNFMTYRKDTEVGFGTVGSRYTVVQNWEAFDFFDEIVGEGYAIYETAGALGKGETVFITAKLPGHIRVPGEEIGKYLLLKLTHDGKGSLVAGFTPVRVVCNNTLQMALSNITTTVRIRHTASAQEKLKEAHKLMGIVNTATEEVGELLTVLKKTPIVDPDAMQIFKQLLFTKEELEEREAKISTKKQNILRDMVKFYYTGVGQDNIIGTKFGVYNAISGYYQNVKTSSNTQNLLESNMFGTNAEMVKKGLNLLLV